MKMKTWFTSKTILFGILWVLVGVAGLFGFADFTPDATWMEYGEILNGLVIIALRFLTTKAVK